MPRELPANLTRQPGDGLREGRLGDEQVLRRPAEAAVVHHGQEVFQLSCVHAMPFADPVPWESRVLAAQRYIAYAYQQQGLPSGPEGSPCLELLVDAPPGREATPCPALLPRSYPR